MSETSGSFATLTFTFDDLACGLPLSAVERVFRAVEVSPLSDAPAAVTGVVNVHGALVPVVELRRRLGLPSKPIHPDQRLVLCQTSRRRLIIVVDTVLGVQEILGSDFAPGEGFEVAPPLLGIAKTADGLVYLADLELFLSDQDEQQLNQALRGRP